MSETYSKDALGYYQILGVNFDADDAQIKINYRERAKQWHPDHNPSEEAKENFQKLSVAYDIINDEDKRLAYDLLCSAYPKEKFPAMFALKVYKNRKGQFDLNVRAVSLWNVVGKLVTAERKKTDEVCNNQEALREVFKSSAKNWLLGWWSPQAFVYNIQAIGANFNNIGTNAKENYQLLVHNALAYEQDNKKDFAFMSALQAGNYADAYQRSLLQKYMEKLGVKPQLKLRPWNYLNLKLVQLIIPLVIVLLSLIPFSVKVVSEKDLLSYFDKKQEISYHQEVQFQTGGTMADDMVVGKIINIPVDVTDSSKLVHLAGDQKIMYGPANDFDVLKQLKSGATVRVTGISPDEIWYRVMLDDGQMGFIRKKMVKAGIGNEIPYGSQIYKKP